jgi:hypothetical protein
VPADGGCAFEVTDRKWGLCMKPSPHRGQGHGERLADRGWEQRNYLRPVLLLAIHEVGAPDDLHVEGSGLLPVQKGGHVGIRIGHRARLHPLLQEARQEHRCRGRGHHRRWFWDPGEDGIEGRTPEVNRARHTQRHHVPL